MKLRLLPLLALALTWTYCSTDDDSDPVMDAPVYTQQLTGDISEQSAEEAKRTINGKWDVNADASKRVACTLLGIEFTEDRFAAGIAVGDDDVALAYGTYELVEDADGNVTSVRLMENDDLIATLTNVVVTETADQLVATFDIEVVYDGDDWPCDNETISGSYEADKDDVATGGDNATADSNFDRIVATWRMSAFSATFEEQTLNLDQYLANFCIDYETGEEDPDCENPSSLEVSFSAYGSYIFVALDARGELIEGESDEWSFVNSEQTQIRIGDGEDSFIGNITTLNDTTFEFTTTLDGVSQTYTFTKI